MKLCIAPDCDNMIPEQKGRGKRRIYCSRRCMTATNQRKVQAEYNRFKINMGCSYCGYNKCGASLGFHHLYDKKVDIDSHNYKSETGIKEQKKCVLLCANCHNELHFNEKN